MLCHGQASCRGEEQGVPLARIDPALMAQAVRLHPEERIPVVLRFEPGDGVRAATRMLLGLGFVASAASPTEAAGDLPAGAVERLATVPGLAAALASKRRFGR
jgi:hypothetical protein